MKNQVIQSYFGRTLGLCLVIFLILGVCGCELFEGNPCYNTQANPLEVEVTARVTLCDADGVPVGSGIEGSVQVGKMLCKKETEGDKRLSNATDDEGVFEVSQIFTLNNREDTIFLSAGFKNEECEHGTGTVRYEDGEQGEGKVTVELQVTMVSP